MGSPVGDGLIAALAGKRHLRCLKTGTRVTDAGMRGRHQPSRIAEPRLPVRGVGDYEVLSLIGAGGMGEVYLARDLQLGRQVALTVLPEMFASDPERLARVRREAQILAALHHPGIAVIHGLEEGLQADGHPVRALVLEHIDGETLAERIARGPIPLDEALPIAREIAAALQAAHDQGVIHRDLKPANIKMRQLMPIAREEAAKALALDPSDTDALAMLGQVARTYDYDRPEAERVLRALGHRPDSFTSVYFRIGAGRGLNDAIDLLERALRVDPLNGLFRAILANAWMWLRQHDRALAEATKLVELDVPFYGAYSVIAQSYVCLGRIRDAVEAAEKAYRAAPWHPRIIGWYAATLKLHGEVRRAEELLREMRRAENPLGVPMGMIVYHRLAGEPDDVLDWYERAVDEREPLAVAYTQDPNPAPLRSNPRWRALLHSMGLVD